LENGLAAAPKGLLFDVSDGASRGVITPSNALRSKKYKSAKA
jgi:hypothetical protein